MTTRRGPYIILFVLLQLIGSLVLSQNRMMQIGDMKADSATITAIAIYPREIRMNILLACQAPEALVKMDNLQKNSSGRFQSALSPYSREVQEKIYDMARYPGLIKKLDGSDRKKRKDVNKIAEEYPEEIRETINDYGRKYYDLYVELSKIESEAEKQFSDLISDYPEKQRVALQELTRRPEVIGLLTSDMRSAVVAGDLYKRKPQWLMQFMDSLAAENAKQNAKSLEAWKNGLESNPQAKKEFEQASKEYAKQLGKDEDQYAPVTENIQINFYAYPYSYWYGYPSWYSYPYWYNVPLWYDWGYYYGTAGWVYMGYPSPYFMHWYFHHHHHYNYYYFTDYCVGHYYSYPHVITPVHQQVHVWVQGTKKEVPENFFKADAERPLRIRDYGKLTTEHQEFIQKHPEKKIDKLEYAATNKERYPYLAKQIEAQPKLQDEKLEPQKPDQTKPPLKKQQQDQPATPDLGEPKQKQQQQQKQEPIKDERPVNPPVDKPIPQPQKQEPIQQPKKEVDRPNLPKQPSTQPVPKSEPKVHPVPTPRTNPQPMPKTNPRPMPKPQPTPKRSGK